MVLWATQVQIQNDISIVSAIFTKLTAQTRYTFARIIAPSHGDLNPHLICSSLGPPEFSTETASRLVKPFLHRSPQSVPILYSGMPFFAQNCPFPWGDLGPHLTRGSLGPPKSSTETPSQPVERLMEASLP